MSWHIYKNYILYISAINFTFLKRLEDKRQFQWLSSCVHTKQIGVSVIEVMLRCISTCNGVQFKFYDYGLWNINNTNSPKSPCKYQLILLWFCCLQTATGFYFCKNRKYYMRCFTPLDVLTFVLNRLVTLSICGNILCLALQNEQNALYLVLSLFFSDNTLRTALCLEI